MMAMSRASRSRAVRSWRGAGCLTLAVSMLMLCGGPARAVDRWPAQFGSGLGQEFTATAIAVYRKKAGVAAPTPPSTIYVAGTFTGSTSLETMVLDASGNPKLDGNGTPLTQMTSLINRGGRDVFVAALDEQGRTIWAVSGGGARDETVAAIDTDDNGNLYLTGSFCGGSKPVSLPQAPPFGLEFDKCLVYPLDTPACDATFGRTVANTRPKTTTGTTVSCPGQVAAVSVPNTFCVGEAAEYDDYQQDIFVSQVTKGGRWGAIAVAGGTLADTASDIVVRGDGSHATVSGTTRGVMVLNGDPVSYPFLVPVSQVGVPGAGTYGLPYPYFLTSGGPFCNRTAFRAEVEFDANGARFNAILGPPNPLSWWLGTFVSPQLATSPGGTFIYSAGLTAPAILQGNNRQTNFFGDRTAGLVVLHHPERAQGLEDDLYVLDTGLGALPGAVPEAVPPALAKDFDFNNPVKQPGISLPGAPAPDTRCRIRRFSPEPGGGYSLQGTPVVLGTSSGVVHCTALTADSDNKLYVAGYLDAPPNAEGSLSFADGPLTTPQGTRALFVAQLDDTLQRTWHLSAGGAAPAKATANAIATLRSAPPNSPTDPTVCDDMHPCVDLYVAGALSGAVKFGTGPQDRTRTAAGATDAFAAVASVFGAWPSDQQWIVGKGIAPPAGAAIVSPAWNADSSAMDFYWSEKNQQLYPLHDANIATIRWVKSPVTNPVTYLPTVTASVQWPEHPQMHIAGAPVHVQVPDGGHCAPGVYSACRTAADCGDRGLPAICVDRKEKRCQLDTKVCTTDTDCLPFGGPCLVPDSAYDLADTAPDIPLRYTSSQATLMNEQFNAPAEGYSVLLYKEPRLPDRLLVVRTMNANPTTRTNCEIGKPVPTNNYLDPEGLGGWVLTPNARYDATAHPPGTRQGPIIPVNTNAGLDVAWYQFTPTYLAWPMIAERFECPWPSNPDRIFVGNEFGSDVGKCSNAPTTICRTDADCGGGNATCVAQERLMPPKFNGVLSVYGQDDPTKAGYNPNEEHGLIVDSKRYTGRAAYALRTDYNGKHCSLTRTKACSDNAGCPLPEVCEDRSDPYVLVKYTDDQQQPAMKVYKVELDPSTGPPPLQVDVTKQVPRPYPLSANELKEACADTCAVSAEECAPPVTACDTSVCGDSPRSYAAFKDPVDNVLWARAPGAIKVKYSYPLLGQFFYPDTQRPECVKWLEQGATQKAFTYQAVWPAAPPTLYVGETLYDRATDEHLPTITSAPRTRVVFEGSGTDASPENKPGTLVRLFDPYSPRTSTTVVNPIPPGILEKLPPTLQKRIGFDSGKHMVFKGWEDTGSLFGVPFVLPNIMTLDDLEEHLKKVEGGDAWNAAAEELYATSRNPNGVPGTGDAVRIGLTANGQTIALSGPKALTAGMASGEGYVTVAFQKPTGATSELKLLQVACGPYQGQVQVIQSDNVFDDKVTVRHNGDFGGDPSARTFEWFYAPKQVKCQALDVPPSLAADSPWSQLTSGLGKVDYTFSGADLKTLVDGCVVVRYKGYNACGSGTTYSQWAGRPAADADTNPRAQLVPGWLSRVVARLNLFDQAQDFHSPTANVNTFSSAIAKAGPRPSADVALNPDPNVVYNQGLIELYHTVLNKGRTLSIDANPLPTDDPAGLDGVNSKLLDVSGRISDLYMLLGNEAWQDALDPTIGWSTKDGQVGSAATALFAFQNRTDSLLEEELALLRGLDDEGGFPTFNRLDWNVTGGKGQIAYIQNYGIRTYDNKTRTASNGVIDEAAARALYPQGHGDAWGHYLTAITAYYELLRHPHFRWLPRADSVSVGGKEVEVDFTDERRFAETAAALARTGAQIVDLTYRYRWVDDPLGQWQGYKEDKGHEKRAWGVFDWAERAGQGAYFDWVVGNAILPPVSSKPPGIEKIDRTTVRELQEIASQSQQIVQQLDLVDQGLNPLGLAKNVVPFDINPQKLDDAVFGGTHFEQVAARAKKALGNAVTVFNRANEYTQLLRRNQDSTVDFARDVAAQERDYNNRLIEIFGTAYPQDNVNNGGVWPPNYDGPDTLDYDVVDVSEITGGKPGEVEGVQVCSGGGSDGQPCNGTDDCPDDDVSKPTHPCVVSTENVQEYTITGSVPQYDACPGGASESPVCQGVTRDNPNAGCTCTFDQFGKLKFDGDGKPVTNEPSLTMRVSTLGLGRIKPDGWSSRQSPGDLQVAHSELLQARAQFDRSLKAYSALIGDIECVYSTIRGQNTLAEEKLKISVGKLATKTTFNALIIGAHIAEIAFRHAKDKIEKVTQKSADSIPRSVGLSTDGFAPARAALYLTSIAVSTPLEILEEASETAQLTLEKVSEAAVEAQDIKLEGLEDDFEAFNLLGTLGEKVRQEPVLRLEVANAAEAVRTAQARWQSTLAKGIRLADELATFRKNTAAKVAEERYNDVAFRLFRNDALQKYRASFDLAARYVYLAAAAYDYETNWPGDCKNVQDCTSMNSRSGRRFLTEIVRQRGLGDVSGDGNPSLGATGLSDRLALMETKFDGLRDQLGFTNQVTNHTRFSLRKELFRLLGTAQSDGDWRQKLAAQRVANLWQVPDFRRFARQPGLQESDGPIAGIVIPFATTITETLNFFGWPSDVGDSTYDASRFATKVRRIGVWFDNYAGLGTDTPYVWLFPAGADVMRSPIDDKTSTVRTWSVVDQIIPTPEDLSGIDGQTWRPSFNLDAPFGGLHKFARIQAFHSGAFNKDEFTQDTRALGRSVWNTRWVLVIPATQLLGRDPEEGLNRFIYGKKTEGGGRIVDPNGVARDGKGVSDILLYFDAYSHSGQ